MTNAGEYSADELASLLNDLNAEVRGTRREDLAKFVSRFEELASIISFELKLDESVLKDEKARYKNEFSLLDRINPFNKERQSAHQRSVKPVRNEVREDKALLKKCCERLEWVRNASQPIEWRTNWNGGVAGAYNEQTGQVEWRESWHTGIAGVYHPDRGVIEWRDEWKHGVAGVFNPSTREIEWKTNWHGGVAGVFNPQTQAVEWRESWHNGICGIYNSLTEVIEWKDAWKNGVAGAWCPESQTVKWHEVWRHGVACVYWDGNTYRSSGSYYGDEDDD